MTAICLKGCGKTWPRDPALEVPCPTCRAGVGARCVKPSGHRFWAYENPHADRDILADRQGHYGPCPWNCCGLEHASRGLAAKAPVHQQLALF